MKGVITHPKFNLIKDKCICKRIFAKLLLGFLEFLRKVSAFKIFLLLPIKIKHGLKTLIFSQHCTNFAENKEITKLLVIFATPFSTNGFECEIHSQTNYYTIRI